MTNTSPALLSDHDLLDATMRLADRERRTTAELLALLAELDTRKLYLAEGYSSLFTYCTTALHLSEPAAYSRITAARATRDFPVILTLLAEGAVTLTTIGLLTPHLTDENHEALLDAARHKSKRDVERLVACLHLQPDIPSSVRKLPTRAHVEDPMALRIDPPSATAPSIAPMAEPVACQGVAVAPAGAALARRSLIAPLARERYLLKVTLSREAHEKLERARALLRHTVPDGDLAAVVDRALTLLLEQLQKRRTAATSRPRERAPGTSRNRHVPAAVRRQVWARDEGRCAFVGSHGRCGERGFLEFHHVRPFATGGVTDVENLELRCRAHNMYEAVRCFGEDSWTKTHVGALT